MTGRTAVSAWRVARLRGWVPIAFVLSTLTGILGAVLPGLSSLFIVSGLLFGTAFVGLGKEMWRVSSTWKT